eukprot:208044-Pleurochrysis_carterae.AAC.1
MGIRVQMLVSRGKRENPAMRSMVDDLPDDSEPITTMRGSSSLVAVESDSIRLIIFMMRP